VFGGLIVQNGEDTNFVALERAAHIELLQALQARQHEEVRFDNGVVDAAASRLFPFTLGSFALVGLASLRRASSTWMVPVAELHLAPLASLDCCGTSLVGTPSRTPLPGSVTIFQPTFSCRRFAVSASTPRSCGLSTPVGLPPRSFWNCLMAATMRSLTSPVMAPLYWPTQARSDCSARRSPCAIASAVSAGACSAGRIGTVVTRFGLTPAAGDGF